MTNVGVVLVVLIIILFAGVLLVQGLTANAIGTDGVVTQAEDGISHKMCEVLYGDTYLIAEKFGCESFASTSQ